MNEEKNLISKLITYIQAGLLIIFLFVPSLYTINLLENIGYSSFFAFLGGAIVGLICLGVFFLLSPFF